MRVVVSYLIGRIALTLMVGGLGQTMPAMPLFLVEALCVEALARSIEPAARPLRFGLVAGVLCGSVGFAAEYGWTQLTSPQPWTTDFLAEAVPTALAAVWRAAPSGALLGMALIGRLPPRPVRRGVALAAAGVMVVLGTNALVLEQPTDVRAEVRLDPVSGDRERTAYVTARISPASAAEDTSWFNAVSWQGGGRETAAMEPARRRALALLGAPAAARRVEDGPAPAQGPRDDRTPPLHAARQRRADSRGEPPPGVLGADGARHRGGADRAARLRARLAVDAGCTAHARSVRPVHRCALGGDRARHHGGAAP